MIELVTLLPLLSLSCHHGGRGCGCCGDGDEDFWTGTERLEIVGVSLGEIDGWFLQACRGSV